METSTQGGSPLGQRMIEDMRMRKLGDKTQIGRWCMDTIRGEITPTPQWVRRQPLKCARSSGVQRSACG